MTADGLLRNYLTMIIRVSLGWCCGGQETLLRDLPTLIKQNNSCVHRGQRAPEVYHRIQMS